MATRNGIDIRDVSNMERHVANQIMLCNKFVISSLQLKQEKLTNDEISSIKFRVGKAVSEFITMKFALKGTRLGNLYAKPIQRQLDNLGNILKEINNGKIFTRRDVRNSN